MTEPTAPNEDRGDRAERAFRDGLRRHADEHDFRPLEPPISGRPSGGLRRWLPAAAVVALVAAVAIPLTVSQFRTGTPTAAVPGDAQAPERGSGVPAPAATATIEARSGWRWESYRVLSYQVPQYWGYAWAPTTDWCTGRPEAASGPFVDVAPEQRPVAMILCPRDIPAARLQQFVSVRPAGSADRGWDLPAGWKVATTELAGYVVEVVHTDEFASVAGEIIASVRPIQDVDPNGCPARAVLRSGADRGSSAEPANPERVSLCQYDLDSASGQLLASKPLAGDDVGPVVDALAAAPKGDGPDDTSCEAPGNSAALVRLWRGSVASDVVVHYAGCRGNGVFGESGNRKLTRDVCQIVLQPPLVFTTGHGAAGRLCMPEPEQRGTATPKPSPTR